MTKFDFAFPGTAAFEEGAARAKAYQRTRNWLTLLGIFLTLALFFVYFALGLDQSFLERSRFVASRFGQLFFFFLFFSLYFLIFSAPLHFYSSFVVENRFGLTNHTLGTWLVDFIKKEILSFGFSVLLVLGFYAMVWQWPAHWWLGAWIGYTFITVVMGKLFPVLIVPLFYRYQPLGDGEVKQKVMDLVRRFRHRVQDVYSLNLSRTTKKANAMFCGLGKTRRIVLSDTLLSHFTADEIEAVVAHELGHFRNKDIWRHIGVSMTVSFTMFLVVFFYLQACFPAFGRQGADDIVQMPLVFFSFFLMSLLAAPLLHAYSRRRERKADEFAVQSIEDRRSFVSALAKLATVNLADPDPHPIVEFLLYDHPAIRKRIQAAKILR